jgi:hypothetical protein
VKVGYRQASYKKKAPPALSAILSALRLVGFFFVQRKQPISTALKIRRRADGFFCILAAEKQMATAPALFHQPSGIARFARSARGRQD